MDRTPWQEIAEAQSPSKTTPEDYVARLFVHAERIALGLEEDDGAFSMPDAREELKSRIMAAASFALGAMRIMGQRNWLFRGRLHGVAGRHSCPEVLTQPLRTYAAKMLVASDRFMADGKPEHWKDMLVCLEIYVAALEHIYRSSCGGTNGLAADMLASLKKSEAVA